MRILWLTWKDHRHPEAGGAEIVLRELSLRLVEEGHDVTFLTCGYDEAPTREVIDGIDIIRVGNNRYVHSFQALLYYARHLRNRFDIVIETVNTAPYFGVFFGKKAKRFVLYHQLAREVWHHELKPPFSHFGYYIMEPLATRLLSLSRAPLIAMSESTRNDLVRFGFHPARSHIISEGIEIEPLENLSDARKYTKPTLLSLGALRGMKRTLDQMKAFEIAKESIPDLQLKIAGSAEGAYGARVLDYIKHSEFTDDIEYLGKVSFRDKIELMERSHLILQTAIKEGWGLTITEAASQGTPAVAYDVDGLRDSIRNWHTGRITEQKPEALAAAIVTLLNTPKLYEHMRRCGWEWSKEITFDKSYQDFKAIVGVA